VVVSAVSEAAILEAAGPAEAGKMKTMVVSP
jgi:hypothetical protein